SFNGSAYPVTTFPSESTAGDAFTAIFIGTISPGSAAVFMLTPLTPTLGLFRKSRVFCSPREIVLLHEQLLVASTVGDIRKILPTQKNNAIIKIFLTPIKFS